MANRNDAGDDDGLFVRWLRELDPMLRAVCAQWAHGANSDVRADFEQDVQIHLWRVRGRLLELAPERRVPYTLACARHVLFRAVAREHSQRVAVVSLNESAPEGPEPSAESLDRAGQHVDRHLVDEINDPTIARSLAGPSDLDRAILDLYFCQGLTDGQAARHLGMSEAKVKARRTRAIRRIRSRIVQTGCAREA